MSTSAGSPSENREEQHVEHYADAEDVHHENEDEDEDEDENEDDDEDEDDPDFDEEEDLDEDDMDNDRFEEEDIFHDAEEGDVHFFVDMGAGVDDGDQNTQVPDGEQIAVERRLLNLISNQHTGALSRSQVLSYLRSTNLGSLLFEDNDDDDEYGGFHIGRSRRRNRDPNRFPKVPSEKGRELMNSGTFGADDIKATTISSKKRLARRILDRELGIGNKSNQRANQGLIAQSMIPSTDADMIINYDDNVYSGQFSDDGNFFFACVKDFKVRMYDTSNPYNWRHYKTVSYPFGSWTLTDASLSPDNKWLAYTSIQSNVCLAPTDPNDTGDPYTLSLSEHNAPGHGWRGFGIWSIRFSGDGRELVAGTNNNSIVVYDIESRRVLHHVVGHDDDVNAVCFADRSSPHILYSGSDDATVKVWDRRSLGDGREAGAFVGHVEGLTYLDSKDDGRYLLSNGKDQSMKLWDLQMMHSTARFEALNPRRHTRHSQFDYRWSRYDDDDWFAHPDDNSAVTFRGHSVLRTLIRCHFSPPGSTNSRYVYSGSHDGKVYVWNLDATLAGVVDVRQATARTRSLPSAHRRLDTLHGFPGWSTVVRDASWHPNAPFIAASALNGWDHARGTVTLHSYNEAALDEGEPAMGTGYDEKLRAIGAAGHPGHGNRGRRPVSDDDDDEDEDYVEDDDDDEDEDEGNEYGPSFLEAF